MGGNNYLIALKEDTFGTGLFAKDINSRTSHSILIDCLNQCLFINQPTPGSVYYAHRWLNPSQRLGIN